MSPYVDDTRVADRAKHGWLQVCGATLMGLAFNFLATCPVEGGQVGIAPLVAGLSRDDGLLQPGYEDPIGDYVFSDSYNTWSDEYRGFHVFTIRKHIDRRRKRFGERVQRSG